MADRPLKGLLVSDFNLGTLGGYLENDESSPSLQLETAPFGQPLQTLLSNREEYDFSVIWTRPEGVIESFGKAMAFEAVALSDILREVDEFADSIKVFITHVDFVFIPSWTLPVDVRGYGLLNWRDGLGLSNLLAHMNLRLCERLGAPHAYVLDATRWMTASGRASMNPKLWYAAKSPFGNEVLKHAVTEIKSALRSLQGQSKKLLIVDLDDTLWGGIVGDQGWDGLRLGGHDPVGEAYVDFQRGLQDLTRRGVLLGIVSKNDEKTALEAIRKHPEMVLKLDDFAGYRINWEDKARNVAELASELKLGLQSVVFIDDNPVERARVRDALPEVFVPEWPEDKYLQKSALLQLACFDTAAVTAEDRERARMYQTERRREASRAAIDSLDLWLEKLEIHVERKVLESSTLQRATQLFNKTNQMNLSTRRLSENELKSWSEENSHRMWTFKISDRFGDLGLSGVLGVARLGNEICITDFILSCRAMGRKVEESMLASAVEFAREEGASKVIAEFLPTAKNHPCLEFFLRSGFKHEPENENGTKFVWNVWEKYPVPDFITLL